MLKLLFVLHAKKSIEQELFLAINTKTVSFHCAQRTKSSLSALEAVDPCTVVAVPSHPLNDTVKMKKKKKLKRYFCCR